MIRSSTSSRFVSFLVAIGCVLGAAGCSGARDVRPAFPSNLDNPVHTRFDAVRIASGSPASSPAAIGRGARSLSGHWEHAAAIGR